MQTLLQSPGEEEEELWQRVLEREEAQNRNQGTAAYSNINTSSFSDQSYVGLKQMALTNILDLEKRGLISRSNQYQELLNMIAGDIRDKHRRRIERQAEIKRLHAILNQLMRKRVDLGEQLETYESVITQGKEKVQSPKWKRKTVMPFSRQYYHMRDLKQAQKVPHYGSYQWIIGRLQEKEVVTFIDASVSARSVVTISSDEAGKYSIELQFSNSQPEGLKKVEYLQLENLLRSQ